MMTNLKRQGALLSRSGFIALGIAMLFTVSSWADGNQSETRLRTQLSGGAIQGKVPSGHADFRSETARNRSRLNVEVEDVNLPNETVLEVFLGTVKIGEIKLRAGFGELELASQDGDAVPQVSKGDIVTVKAAGAAILTGAF